MKQQQTLLIVDDDQDAAHWLKYLIENRFPGLAVDVRLSPDVTGRYDIYLIDNDFHGTHLGADLVQAIRAVQPGALVIAFSACLERQTLKKLLNLGCDGACDKSDAQDTEYMLQIIEAHLSDVTRDSAPADSRSFFGALRSIRDLLREWNQRLEVGHSLLEQNDSSTRYSRTA